MKDSEIKAAQLIDRYLDGNCTDQERILVEGIYHKSALKKELKEKEIDFGGAGRKSWAHIAAATSGQKERRFALWPRIVSVAAAIALVTSGIWMYTSRQEDSILSSSTNDVAPGKYGATLTLANGKKISLTDAANGELAEETGVKISKTADGQLVYEIVDSNTGTSGSAVAATNTLSTSNGETYQIQLPDGTKAWLNAASSIQFPSSFSGLKQRQVEVTGEVYLEVYKDKNSPFLVLSNDQQIEVLGTHFNVNSYADEKNIKTTLLEGAVRLSPVNDASVASFQHEVVLKPGQQSIFDGQDIQVRTVDVEEMVAWKEGDFRFVDRSVTEIMKHIARWYNVQVFYEDNVSDIKLNASISRNRNVSQVLKMMEKTDEVHFKIEGRRIIVRR